MEQKSLVRDILIFLLFLVIFNFKMEQIKNVSVYTNLVSKYKDVLLLKGAKY